MSLLLMTIKLRFSSLAVLLVLVTITLGCGPSPPPTGAISGTVTSSDGEAVECYLVLSDPVSRENTGAKCNEQGVFEKKGIPFGEYKVAVQQMLDAHSATGTPLDKRIPKKYRSIKTTELSVSIQDVEPVVFNIEMK